MIVKKGDIFYADLSNSVGSEQGGVRPVVIIQNNIGNTYSPTVIAAAITSKLSKNHIPTHVDINSSACGLPQNSVVLAEQVRTIDKTRLKEKKGKINSDSMKKLNKALSISFGLAEESFT